MPETRNLRAVADRIEALIEELRGLANPRARETAEELVRLLVDFYGAGLGRILDLVRESAGAEELLDRLGDDELVASLLLLHDLHPRDVESRIHRALERVRPYLGSHGGDVRLLGVEDGVVHLRLLGSCNGCPSSAVTMKLAVERAIAEAAPEVTRIEVEGVSEEARAAGSGGDSLVQIGSLANGAGAGPGGNGGNGCPAAGEAREERSADPRQGTGP